MTLLGLLLLLLPGPARAAAEAPAAAPAVPEAPEAPEAGEPTTWQRAKSVRTRAPELPDAATRAAMTRLVTAMLRAAPLGRVPPEAPGDAAALGLHLEQRGAGLWLTEAVADGRGDGLVAIHLGPLAQELILQAPHPISDHDTGALVGRLFDDSLLRPDPAPDQAVRAVMIATTHRAATEVSDPSAQPAMLLQAATDAVALALVDPLVVQIHGFDPDTSAADGVASAGMARSGDDLARRARVLLAQALDLPPLAGADEVPLLAALRNVQGRLLADRVRFLHLELSADLRDRLRNRAADRLAFRLALQALAARSSLPDRPPTLRGARR